MNKKKSIDMLHKFTFLLKRTLPLTCLGCLFFGTNGMSAAAEALSRHRTYTLASKPPMFIFNFFESFQRPAVKVSA
jgi:hypothetical protein